MAALQDANVLFLMVARMWSRRMRASRADRKISIYTFDLITSMQPSMCSPAADTKWKKPFHTGWLKPDAAGTIST
jgi:hypothetical protein